MNKSTKALWDTIKQYDGMSSRQVADILGVGKSTVNDIRRAAREGKFNETTDAIVPKILTLDIESKPHLSYHWSMWDQNIYADQVKEYGGMLCVAAKWLGDDKIDFLSEWGDGREEMICGVYDLLEEADIVVTYNGDKYDIKRMNNEFLDLGFPPPAPYKSVDLIKANRQRFDLPSRKLDFIAGYVADDHKIENTGWKLWRAVLDGDIESRKLMEEYNRQDVVVTEKVYTAILPWIPNHPHLGMYTGNVACCPWCGNDTFRTAEKTNKAGVQAYPLRQCTKCGGWVRSTEKLNQPLTHRAAR